MIALFSIHFIHLSTSFFFQAQNSVYIFPHISPYIYINEKKATASVTNGDPSSVSNNLIALMNKILIVIFIFFCSVFSDI